MEAVLTVVDLVFTTGHTAPSGADLIRADLVDRALGLARMLRALLPATPGSPACLPTSCSPTPAALPASTPRAGWCCSKTRTASLWDREAIAQGRALVREALRRRPPTRFALMAAIAAVHDEAQSWEETDWREIVGLYDVLLRYARPRSRRSTARSR